MKYVTEQFVKKIKAPIVCRFDGQELSFGNGLELAAFQFDKNYLIESISVEGEKVALVLCELPVPNINSVGDELVSGDDWIKDHVAKFGKEPNLFDGA